MKMFDVLKHFYILYLKLKNQNRKDEKQRTLYI